MKESIILLFMGIMALGIYSCNSSAAKDKSGIEYTSEYICPMHCEGSGSSSPGKCPVCKMDYIKNDQHGHAEDLEEHDHHHDHSDHDHNH